MSENDIDPSDKEYNQRKVFEFLKQKYRSGELFTLDEVEKETTWQGTTFPTYWSKHYKDFATKLDGGKYQVNRVFRAFLRWEKFRNHVTQNRRVTTDYEVSSYDSVLIFEFFMPLTHENPLRSLLDELFYRDPLMNLLRQIDANQLRKQFQQNDGEENDSYFERVCDWLSMRFGGYSISHVNGRFRAGRLRTTAEAADAIAKGERYIVDETTAIVRFIFPCGESRSRTLSTNESAATEPSDAEVDQPSQAQKEAEQIRWFFETLFVQSILEAVSGEDEIWVMESGMANRLHIFRGVS